MAANATTAASAAPLAMPAPLLLLLAGGGGGAGLLAGAEVEGALEGSACGGGSAAGLERVRHASRPRREEQRGSQPHAHGHKPTTGSALPSSARAGRAGVARPARWRALLLAAPQPHRVDGCLRARSRQP